MNKNLVAIESEQEPSPFRLVSALGIAGLISGIILVATYVYTNPLIIANKETAMQEAIFRVLPGCTDYQTLILAGNKLVPYEAPREGEQHKQEDKFIYSGFNEQKKFIGFAIPGSEPGFQDIITAIFGYDATKEIIIGFEILDSKETPGLGDKIFKDQDFQMNFKNLSVLPEMMAVKKGERKNPNEVEAITGATISSKAVVKLLNNTMDFWKVPVANYIKEGKYPISNE